MLRRWATVAAAGALAVALVGCGPAPWNLPADDATPSAPRETKVAPPPVPNDLSGGSTSREVSAGAVTAAVDYWSDLSMDRWTATALKPVSLSLSATVTPNDGQSVHLQKATMIAVPGNDDGDMSALAPSVDQAPSNPGYLALAPYSYSQTFYVGEVPAEATFVTVRFTYEFMVQTTPTSAEYAKQTATDSLTIAIADRGGADEDGDEDGDDE